jgi:hypothetical protein
MTVLSSFSAISKGLSVPFASYGTRVATFTIITYMGARIRIASVPATAGVNGPDDLIAVGGDEAIREVFELSQPVTQLAVASPEGTEATEGLGVQPAQDDKANHQASPGYGVDFSNSPSAATLAALLADQDGSITGTRW